jgi:ABC-2 family transporter protein
MMRTLIYKELRTLLPFAWLIVGLMALILGSIFAIEFPDTNTLDPAKWLADDRGGALAFLLFFGLIIGAGLLVNESEQGTLTFLDGLPVSRTRIFAGKMIAGFLVLSIGPVIGLSVDVLLDSISRDSMDGPFPWRFLLIELGLEMAVAVYVLSIAAVLSFLRKWFALVVGLIFWCYLWLKESGPDWIALLDPYEALESGLMNGGIQIPWRHLGFQLAASAALIAIGWLAFHALGDRIQYAIDRFQRHRILHGIGTGIRFLAPVVWIAAIVKLTSNTPSESPHASSVTAGESAFGSRETEYYEFLFRNSQKEMATPMMDNADLVHLSVARLFSAPKTTARIVVDLASPVAPHAAGQTNWTKIRLPFDESVDQLRFNRILGHETAHVYIEQLTNSRTSKLFRYTRFLHEGLATYVHQEYFSTEEQKQSNRREVAAAWSRGKIPLATLCDDRELGSSRDRNLVYPLGEVFIRALVQTHGKESVPRLLRAFGRPNAPMGLGGLTLWRDTMQAAEIAFDRVEAAYESACNDLLNAEAEYVAKFPRIAADIRREGDEIVIKPRFEGDAPGKMICVRYVDDFLGNDTRYLHQRDDGTFSFSRLDHPAEKLRYMLGWFEDKEDHPVFEPWVEVAMP